MLYSILRLVEAMGCCNSKNSVVVLPEKAKAFIDNNYHDRVIDKLELLRLCLFLGILLYLLIFC